MKTISILAFIFLFAQNIFSQISDSLIIIKAKKEIWDRFKNDEDFTPYYDSCNIVLDNNFQIYNNEGRIRIYTEEVYIDGENSGEPKIERNIWFNIKENGDLEYDHYEEYDHSISTDYDQNKI